MSPKEIEKFLTENHLVIHTTGGLFRSLSGIFLEEVISDKRRPVANLTLSPFPGNCGIVVASKLSGDPKYLEILLEKTKQVVRNDDYGFLLYSCERNQEPLCKALRKVGFKQGKWYGNPRHEGHQICIFSFDVNEIKKTKEPTKKVTF